MDPGSLDRRGFLRATALGGAGLLAAAGLAECGSTPRPHPRPVPPTPATEAEWTAFASSLSGRLVRRGQAGYGVGRLLYNPKFDGLMPVALAYCATPTDVARAIGFARAHGYPIAPRSGGHSYGGYSSGTGRLVIDVTPMSTVAIAASPGATATVGAGARLIDVYNGLGGAGQLVPGGSCPTVGIAGLTLGGGVGVLSRRYGLASDNLVGLTIVTADGRVLECSAQQHPDLFWACRGGGGGNFGVVTSFRFQTHAMPQLSLFTYDFNWAAAANVLGAWQRWTQTVNPSVWSNCQLLSGAGTTVRIAGVACATSSQAAAWLAPLLSAIGTAPTYSFVGGEPYLRAMMIEAGCSALTVAACHLDTQPGGVLSRDAFTASSNYVAAPMGGTELDQVVSLVDTLARELPSLGGGMVFDALGGAVDDITAADTAFVHRGFLASIQSSYSWSGSTPATQIAQGATWLESVRATSYDPATGAYQNYIDPTLSSWQSSYYRSNLARLESIKSQVDPDSVFSFAQSVPKAT